MELIIITFRPHYLIALKVTGSEKSYYVELDNVDAALVTSWLVQNVLFVVSLM